MSSSSSKNRRLAIFQRRSLEVAGAVGFRHFDLYLRGKEEILVVVHKPDDSGLGYGQSMGSFNFGSQAMYMRKASLMDLNNMENLNQLQVRVNPEEPPASPCENEIYKPQFGDTAFLIGSYQRYKRPLVWIRSHHEHIKSDGDQRDLPLDLKSLDQARWETTTVKLWEIVCELVGLCLQPPPVNPLEIERDFFDNATYGEAVLASGASIKLLESAFINKNSSKFRHKIYSDLMYLRKIHFGALLSKVECEQDDVATTESNSLRRRTENLGQSMEALSVW